MPHRFVLNSLWQLPSPSAGVARLILGNWQASGIFSWQSGFPLNFSTANDTSFSLPTVGDDQAQLYVQPAIHQRIARRPHRELVPDAVLRHPAGQLVRQCRTQHHDRAGHRQSRLRSAQSLPHHGKEPVAVPREFFNFFNHPLLENPDTTVGDTNFGRILGARSPRTVQLALRLTF
ncbi:MAG: hypothetical protein QM757_13225 [Paludibaculum sp.]